MSPVPAHSRLDKQLTATAEAFDSEWTLYMFVSGMKAIRSMAFGDVFGGPEKRDVIYVCEPGRTSPAKHQRTDGREGLGVVLAGSRADVEKVADNPEQVLWIDRL